MGAICIGSDSATAKLKEFVIDYDEFNNEPITNYKSKGKKKIEGNEIKLNEHYKTFMMNKTELEKTNKELYDVFFKKDSKNPNPQCFEFKGISADDDKKFQFFFNLRIIKSVKIIESNIFFPKFCSMYFPKFKPEESNLTSVTINDSEIIFNDTSDDFNKLRKLSYLDLSYNNIRQLPMNFYRLDKISYLNLKRNNISKFNVSSFVHLKELILSENEFKKVPNEIFSLEKLEKLNMNSNQLSELDINLSNDNKVLKYLYLADNKFTQIPPEITSLKNLNHLSLDSNKITEINPTIFNNTKMNIKISLSNNQIKGKEGIYKGFKNDILEYPPPTTNTKTIINQIEKQKEDKETDEEEHSELIQQSDVYDSEDNFDEENSLSENIKPENQLNLDQNDQTSKLPNSKTIENNDNMQSIANDKNVSINT